MKIIIETIAAIFVGVIAILLASMRREGMQQEKEIIRSGVVGAGGGMMGLCVKDPELDEFIPIPTSSMIHKDGGCAYVEGPIALNTETLSIDSARDKTHIALEKSHLRAFCDLKIGHLGEHSVGVSPNVRQSSLSEARQLV